MKIKKLTEAKLLEDEVNPANKEEVSDEIQDQTNMPEAKADKLANEIKGNADAIGAKTAVLAIDPELDYEDAEIKNDLTAALDEAYAYAKRKLASQAVYGTKRDIKFTGNVLVEGLPGSGKTAIVENWCSKNGLTLVAFNATDPKIEASINGIPLRDLNFDKEDASEGAAITYAYNLEQLEKLLYTKHPELAGKCVLFVDELNRQKSQQLRRPFMSVFNEKRNASGALNFRQNLLFSVVCINPYGDQFHDPGVGELVPAEKNRFIIKRQFDSTKESSLSYFDGKIKSDLLDLDIVPPNSIASNRRTGFVGPVKELSAGELEEAKTAIKEYELANYILNHDDFRFDERGDANQIWLEKADYLTARSLTEAIDLSGGDPKKFLDWVDNDSGLSKRVVDMFHDILDSYIVDENELWQDYGLVKKPAADQANDTADAKAATSNTDIEDDDEDFEDDDVAAAGNKVGGATSSDVQDILNKIDGWFI